MNERNRKKAFYSDISTLYLLSFPNNSCLSLSWKWERKKWTFFCQSIDPWPTPSHIKPKKKTKTTPKNLVKQIKNYCFNINNTISFAVHHHNGLHISLSSAMEFDLNKYTQREDIIHPALHPKTELRYVDKCRYRLNSKTNEKGKFSNKIPLIYYE